MTGSLRTIAGLAAVAALAVSISSCSSPSVNEAFTDVEALAFMEDFVAESVAQLEAFPGFETRSIELKPCMYGMNEDKSSPDHDKVELNYYFAESVSADPLVTETYPEVLETYWTEQGYTVEREMNGEGELAFLEFGSGKGLIIEYRLGALTGFHLGVPTADCLAMDEEEFTTTEPQGGVRPENDEFDDFSERDYR